MCFAFCFSYKLYQDPLVFQRGFEGTISWDFGKWRRGDVGPAKIAVLPQELRKNHFRVWTLGSAVVCTVGLLWCCAQEGKLQGKAFAVQPLDQNVLLGPSQVLCSPPPLQTRPTYRRRRG